MHRSSALCVAAAFALCTHAHAQQSEELTYISAPLTGTQSSYANGVLTYSAITGTLTGAATFSGGDLTGLDFAFDGVQFDVWSGSTPCVDGCLLAPGEFEPVGNGQWELSYYNSPYPAPPVTLDIGPGGDTVNYLWGSPVWGGCVNLANGGLTGSPPTSISPCSIVVSGDAQGVWTPVTEATPELDPGSTGSALLLLLGGIAVLTDGCRRAR